MKVIRFLYISAVIWSAASSSWGMVPDPYFQLLSVAAEAPRLLIHPAEIVSVSENVQLTLELEVANPPEAATFIYSVTPPLANSVLDEETGIFEFTPDFNQAGIYPLIFSATDGSMSLVSSATITVEDVPLASLTIHPSDSVTLLAKEQIRLELEVEHAGDTEYLFSFEPLIRNATIDSETGVFEFTPDYTQAGEYTINFKAQETASELVRSATIIVEEVEFPRLIILPSDSVSIEENDQTTLELRIENPGTSSAVFSVTPVIKNSILNEETGIFEFAPDSRQAGVYSFVFSASDGLTEFVHSATVEVSEDTSTHLIVLPDDSISILENEPLTLKVEVENPGAYPYQYSCYPIIENVQFDSDHGLFYFTPDNLQAGQYTFYFSASDGFFEFGTKAEVDVLDNNRLPIVQVSFRDVLEVREGDRAAIQVTAFDFDTDNILRFDVEPQLRNLTIDSETGQIVFTPDYFQSGEYPIDFLVSDGHDTVAAHREIHVIDQNRLPEVYFNPEMGGAVEAGDTFYLLVFASDLDNDTLTYEVDALPPNSEFNPETGRFVFTPGIDQYRDQYDVKFTVSDGKDHVDRTFTFNVTAPLSPLFEFNTNGDAEGWQNNSEVQAVLVENGTYSAATADRGPTIFRSNLHIDSFTQQEFVMRIFMTNASTLTVSFVKSGGEVVGPIELDYDTPFEYKTLHVNFQPLFPFFGIAESVRIDMGEPLNYFSIDYIGFLQSDFPTVTPTPNPSHSPTPTVYVTPAPTPIPTSTRPPTVTQTPTITETPTITSTPTVTNTPTPTPTPTPLGFEFEDFDYLNEQFDILTPNGFLDALVQTADAGESDLFKGNALFVQVEPGEAVLLISKLSTELTCDTAWIKTSVFVSSNIASVALIGFNDPMDGQFGYYMAERDGLPAVTEHEMELFYQPPSGAVRLGIQVANPSYSTETVNALLDRLRIEDTCFEYEQSELPLNPDGSFDESLSALVRNINAVDGSVQISHEIEE